MKHIAEFRFSGGSVFVEMEMPEDVKKFRGWVGKVQDAIMSHPDLDFSSFEGMTEKEGLALDVCQRFDPEAKIVRPVTFWVT